MELWDMLKMFTYMIYKSKKITNILNIVPIEQMKRLVFAQ